MSFADWANMNAAAARADQGPVMSDEDFEDGLAALRAMNMPDVKV